MSVEELLASPKIVTYSLTSNHLFDKRFDCDNALRDSCGKHKLNDFLFEYGRIAVKYRHCRINVIENETDIIAYYSLAHDSLHIDSKDEDFYNELHGYIDSERVEFVEKYCSSLVFPAIKIEHMAVNRKYQSLKLGTYLLDVIIGELLENEHWYGCQYITVDALNNKDTVKFYTRNKFQFVSLADHTQATRRMYRPLFEYFTAK